MAKKIVNGEVLDLTSEEEAELAALHAAAQTRSTSDVKSEAARRIDLVMKDYEQRNALALGVETILDHGLNPANWPTDRQSTLAATMAKWAKIKAIRTASDEIEAMSPIPADFQADGYWPD